MRQHKTWRVVRLSSNPPRGVTPRHTPQRAVIGVYGIRWVKITAPGDFRWVTDRDKATLFRDVAQAEAAVRGFLMLCNSDATVETVPRPK